MNKWIGIEDKLPKWLPQDIEKDSTAVEVKAKDGRVWIDAIDDDQKIWYLSMKDLEVTHWRYPNNK